MTDDKKLIDVLDIHCLLDEFVELNLGNYTDDDVRDQQDWALSAHDALTKAAARLEALTGAQASGVRVKPLQWSGRQARSPIGVYTVKTDNNGDWRAFKSGWTLYSAPKVPAIYSSEDEAMGAAQADYRRCILSAIETTAPPDTRELVEALRGLLDAHSKPDDRLCCDGRGCGCMGATVHQQAEHYARAALAKHGGDRG